MQFNSYIFIMLFLPILCIGYYSFILKNKGKAANIFLLISSLVFCAFAGKESLIILVLSIIYNYVFYKGITYFKRRENNIKKQIILFCGIAINLLILFYFKYYNFFVDIVNLLFGTSLSIRELIHPLGISFVVFQQIAFLMDSCYRDKEECNVENYALFISFFPHISSGPIILYDDLIPSLRKKRDINWDDIASGIYLFVMGLGKKVLIADVFAKAVDWGYGNISILNSTSAIFITIAYTVQIYFDFSGYSDMAIGISRILQLDLPQNFNSPYKSKTILEFWDKWHMSLTRFLTRYFYIPLGGSRKGTIRMCINTMVVFLCSGLWHGASVTFIIWGAMHGGFMLFTKCFQKVFNKLPSIINQGITLLFINFTWILFRSGSLGTFKQIMTAIIKADWGRLDDNVCAPFKPIVMDITGLGSIDNSVWASIAMIGVWIIILKGRNLQERIEDTQRVYSLFSCLGVAIVAIWSIMSFSGVSSFIYSMF